MRLRLIRNITRQGVKGMWRNRGMGLASVSSISAVLIILGIILIMILSINSLVGETQTKFDEIEVYLQDDVTDENMNLIEEKVNENEGISSITFRSKNEALELMRDDWEDNAYLLDGLEEENTLTNSYIIQLKDIKYADQVVHVLSDMDGIEKIDYHKEIIDKLAVFSNYIRVGCIALIAALIFVSIFIISNTIKLTVSARKREINIMKYVGATNGYIKGPFIMEGILFGLLGAVISIVVVYFGYEYFFNTVSQKVYAFFTIFTMGLVP